MAGIDFLRAMRDGTLAQCSFQRTTDYDLVEVEDGRVVLRVYDALGQQVRRVDLGLGVAGYYYGPDRAVLWDGRDQRGRRVGSGLYLCELQVGKEKVRHKIALVR